MKQHNGEWLDRMYNNRALVPDFGGYFERWAAASAEAVRSQQCVLDVAYGAGDKERLDVFAAEEPNAPVMVFVHGGYWRALDKSDVSFVAPAFTRTGACVVIPNYALAPAVTIPQITMQLVHALAWVWRHAARHGGDPERITVVGHSAGGHLAAMLQACLWPLHAAHLPPDLVKGALAISGLYDLEPIMHTPFLQSDLRLTPEQVRQASPALLPPPAQGRLYAVVGGDESPEFVRQNQLIRSAWGEQRVPVCEALTGLNHFSVLDALVDPGHRLHRLARELLDCSPTAEAAASPASLSGESGTG